MEWTLNFLLHFLAGDDNFQKKYRWVVLTKAGEFLLTHRLSRQKGVCNDLYQNETDATTFLPTKRHLTLAGRKMQSTEHFLSSNQTSSRSNMTSRNELTNVKESQPKNPT